MKALNDYREIVGDEIIANIYKKARPLYGKRVIHINSTFYGGGVAEMLSSIVPLMNDVGLDAGWRIIRGAPEFFLITKKFHNIKVSKEDQMYFSINTILKTPSYREQIIETALKEAKAWRQRYKDYKELEPIFIEIDRMAA